MLKFLMKKILRWTGLVILAIAKWKSWPEWLAYKLGLLRNDGVERTFRLRNGLRFFYVRDLGHLDLLREIDLGNEYFKQYIPKTGDVIVDVGAHIGIFSVIAAAKAPDIKVHAYEPVPLVYATLERNIALNNLSHVVFPHHAAVSGTSGPTTLYTADLRTGSTAIFEPSFNEMGYETITVPGITLREIIKEAKRCDLLKMDVEGAEFDIILKTSPEVFKSISRIVMEYHADPAPIVGHLREHGYHVSVDQPRSGNCGILYAKAER